MSSSFFSKSQLAHWYTGKKLSTYKIADYLRCNPKTVYYWLKRFGIPTRPRKIVNITRFRLEKLYTSGLSMEKIGKQFGLSASAVFRKMRKARIVSRSSWETNIIHPRNDFDDNPVEKAYLIGFRLGDLNVRQKSIQTFIEIKSNTTQIAQLKLMKSLFTDYGPIWIGKSKTVPYVFNFSTLLNNSFSFLLPKFKNIPEWILKSRKLFWAFLAGYSDAEGTIGIYNGRAKFRIGTYDKIILEQIHKKLLILKIKNSFLLERKTGIYYGRKFNGDFYRVSIMDRTAIHSCLTQLLPYLKHENRKRQSLLALQNVKSRL